MSNRTSDDFQKFIEKRDRMVGKIRIGALNRVFGYRYGRGTKVIEDRVFVDTDYVFPDDDAGLEDLKILLHHYAWSNPLAVPRILKMRAPWAGHNRATSIIEEIFTYPRGWRSETLGKVLRFTGAEWKLLRVRTIAPIDMSKEDRRAYSQELAVRRRRIQRGQQRRDQYLAQNSLSRMKPWLALGISRSEWYRQGKPTLAQVSEHKDKTETPDEPPEMGLGTTR